MISKDELCDRVEPHFIDELLQPTYKIKIVNPNVLLTHTRFDLGFKLLYLEMLEKDAFFARKIYKEHIRAFSLNAFQEPGQDDKNSIDIFYSSFWETFNDIKFNGFDSKKSLVPLSKNGSIANGSHRVASAIYLNKDVACVEIGTDDPIYDYQFFYKRNVPVRLLDIAATKFAEYSDNVHIAFVWPTAKGYDKKIEEIIPNIVYRKDVRLTANGAHNLLSQIYFGETWLGSVENNFSGSEGKLVECFKTFDPVRVIAFQADDLDDVVDIKDKVRQIFSVGKHSIHITDNKEEAIRVARVVFNDNAVHFLNYGQPNKYRSTHTKLSVFERFIADNKLKAEDVVLDSGAVLSLYGLREASDIDYLATDTLSIEPGTKGIECHDDELKYHDQNKDELIYNPKNYFYFNDFKFLAFDQVFRMKKKRGEDNTDLKDLNDCDLMESLIEGNKIKKIKSKIKQILHYEWIKTKAKIVKFLKWLGLFEFARRIYRSAKK